MLAVRAQDRGEWVALAVQDTGSGVPEELRERIFTPFFTTRTRGTGLGLSIVKKIVEGHNGRATLECPPEGGSIFTLWLPKIHTNGS
jgi:signal transduction histidine kinase